MSDRGRRPRSVLTTVWILLACAALGTGIGLVVRSVRDGDGDGGPQPIKVRPARRGPQSPAALWLFGATTVRLDPTTLSDARDAGFRGFGSVLGGEGVVSLFDPGTGRVGVVDTTRNRIVGETTVPVQRGVDVDVMPVLATQRGALWLVTGPGRLSRYELASGAITDVALPTDVVSEEAAGGPPAPGATRVVADDEAAWAVYDLGVTGNPPLTAVVRLAPDGTVTTRAALPSTVAAGGRLAPQAVTVGEGAVWLVGSEAAVALDADTLAVRHSFGVQSQSSVELHDAAIAAGSLWSYDALSGALLRIGVEDGEVRQRVALVEEPPAGLPAPAQIVGVGDVLWVRVRVGSPTMLGQRVTRIDARSGDITGRFDAPPELEVGAIAVSR
jgi:hypothetical protein